MSATGPTVPLGATEMRDGFGREITYLRVSITDRCNLRCRYCMPERCGEMHQGLLSDQELQEIVSMAVELGIRKVRITGGEPLVRRDCPKFCEKLAALPGLEELTLTTNGILLSRQAEALKAAGVRRVNVSLDTLNPEKYRTITGGGDLAQVFRGLEAAWNAGLGPIKLNTVLLGGWNDDEIPDLVRLTRDNPLEVRFIELMPLGPGAGLEQKCYVPGKTVLERVPELQPMPVSGGVAELYALPGAKGQVGLIRPLSCQFCGSCNRLRLTAEGTLKPCLHTGQEIPVRGLHGAALAAAFRQAILEKPRDHGPLDALHRSGAGRSMNAIGG